MLTELSNSLVAHTRAPCLIITDANDQQTLHEMKEGESVLVGSAASCAIRLPSDEANPLHCMFKLTAGTLWVQDWNTDGKTLLNASPISDTTQMSGTDKVQIGSLQIEACLSPPSQHDKDPDKSEANVTEEMALIAVDDSTAHVEEASSEQETQINLPNESPDELLNETSSDLSNHLQELKTQQLAQSEIDSLLKSYDQTSSAAPLEAPANASSGRNALDIPSESYIEELEVLRCEVSQLQIELAEKDFQLLQLNDSNQPRAEQNVVDEAQTEQLVERLEQLLAELSEADEKTASLERLLQVSDDANLAEQEERRQLESWVDQIEQRVSARAMESEAELEVLQKSVQEERLLRAELESQLEQALSLSDKNQQVDPAARQLIEALREQNTNLEARLAESLLLVEKQSEASVDVPEVDSQALGEMQERIHSLESELVSERADIAREKEQLIRFQQEMEKRLNEVKQTAQNDSKVNAMKQHLRELHQEEKIERQERFERSLGGRISRIWQKLDSR